MAPCRPSADEFASPLEPIKFGRRWGESNPQPGAWPGPPSTLTKSPPLVGGWRPPLPSHHGVPPPTTGLLAWSRAPGSLLGT